MRKQQKPRDFDHYIEEYLYTCQSRGLRAKTMASYEQTLYLFARWAREQEHLESPCEVREQTIRHYICDLQERGKYSFCISDHRKLTNCPERRRDYRQPVSVTTINNYIRNLKAFFGWYEDFESGKNPMEKIRQLTNERRPKEYLEDKEVNKLLDSFDRSYFSESRDSTVIQLILDTGMRLGECLMLSAEHLDMQERAITIPAELTKGRKRRCVFFSQKTARALQRWLRFKDRYVESSYLFPTKEGGQPVALRSFESNFRKYIQRAGIEKEVSPHALRNNFAKRCLMAGMDVYTLSRILGHSSVTVTERAYLDLTDEDLKRRYRNFSPMEHLAYPSLRILWPEGLSTA